MLPFAPTTRAEELEKKLAARAEKLYAHLSEELEDEDCLTLARLGISVRAREETALVEGTGV